MDTTTFLPTSLNTLGTQYMDWITAALLTLAAVAMITLASLYVCAGISKRVR